LGQDGTSLHDVLVVELGGSGVVVEFENSLHEAEVVVLELKESRQHVDEILLIFSLLACLVGCAAVALLLQDACLVVKGGAGHKALLSCGSLDVEDETVGGELLATLYSQDVAYLDVRPRNGNPSFDPPRDKQPLNLLAIDDVGNAPLPKFERKILEGHQAHIDGDCSDRKGYVDLVVLFGHQDERE